MPSKAAEEKEMHQIDAYERQEVRLQRLEALARRRELQRRALSERPQSPNCLPALPREEKRSL